MGIAVVLAGLACMVVGAAIVPTALAVTEAVGTGLPGPSTGVLAVGSAVVVLFRDAFIVPAPGAVVVGMPTNRRAHLIGMS